MDLLTLRYGFGEKATIGLFFTNGVFSCYTLEDKYREGDIFKVKVPGETCIPNGRYEVKLRTEGSFHENYLKKYGPDFHKGMLHVTNVPNFEWILIHIVNDDEDTDGCLGVGDQANHPDTNFMGHSGNAYKRIYPPIANALISGERVFIEYRNIKTTYKKIFNLI